MPWWGWMLIVIAILVVILVVLYIVGNRLQKKQSAQKEAMLQAAQPVTMLVIDKKMLPMKDANLPKQVLESTPKRYQKAKLPIVKAKIGPKISILIADEKVFDLIPVKKEIKAEVSGLYIVGVKGIHGTLEAPVKKKKGFFARFKKDKAPEVQSQPKQSGKSAKNTKAAAANTNMADKKNKKKK